MCVGGHSASPSSCWLSLGRILTQAPKFSQATITFAGDKSSQPLPGMVHKFTAVPGTLLGRCEF